MIIAVEKRQKINRQIPLVVIRQAAHDAKVQRDIAPIRRHQNIAGVHIGVEKAVVEHLREKNLHAITRQLF